MTNTTHRGHGGRNGFDQGAVGSGTTEYKEVSWINDQLLKASKWKDTSDFSATTVNQNLVNIVNNVNRVAKATDTNISNHMNAFNRQATGVEVWYYLGDNKGRELAEKLSLAIAGALGLINRGAKPTANFYVVRNTVGTTALIEWCFVDNPNDIKKWNANKNKAITAALSILGYKNTTNEPQTKPTPAPVTSNFKVGDTVTVAKHAISYQTGEKIANFVKGSQYQIKEIKNVKQSNSRKAYLLGKGNAITGWVLEQDLVGGKVNKPKPAPKPKPKPTGGRTVENGTIKINQSIKVRTAPNTGARVVATYKPGQNVKYDSYIVSGGYIWVSWIGKATAPVTRLYMAIGNHNGRQRTSLWGRFV